MGHCIQAIIGRPDTLQIVRERFEIAQLVALTQGFAMVPTTGDLLDAIYAAYPAEDRTPVAGFAYLTQGLKAFLAELSIRGPVVYIETEYFGGSGAQAATAYIDGKAALLEVESSTTRHPINDAAHMLGVSRTNSLDEFDALGLGNYRGMDQWE